ncbi:MAG: sulfite exporter TauE/SafE family protein [Sulfuricellaceae bacterium]
MEFLIITLAGSATGLVLGLLGSGGSIIALPALLYLLNIPPKEAVAMSLGVVAVTAAVAAFDNWKRGNLDLKPAAVFALFGAAGTAAGSRVGAGLPVALQLGGFALIMFTAAYRMLRRQPPTHAETGHPGGRWRIPASGVGVGMLTGTVGVGGGFLIVPALSLFAGLPMKRAVGTSLAVVTVNAASGFLGYLGVVPIDYPIMAGFTAVTLASSFAGTRLAHRLPHHTLKRIFGVFLIVTASYIVLKSVITL